MFLYGVEGLIGHIVVEKETTLEGAREQLIEIEGVSVFVKHIRLVCYVKMHV